MPRPPRQLTALKTAYARAARGSGAVLSRLGVLPDNAPPRDHRWRHWMYSLTRVHDSAGIADLDVPWWTYNAIDAVQEFIDGRERPVRAFEWGSGASTVWLSRRVDTVISIEHHREFGEMMTQRVAEMPHVTVAIVEPVASPNPVVPSLKEGQRGMDFAAYVAQIDAAAVSGLQFDLVVVDGRAREACVAAALPRLAPGGIVVFDNSWRIRYRRAIKQLGVNERIYRGITPTTPYPEQTSIITRDGQGPAH